jgi:hypothetical protein
MPVLKSASSIGRLFSLYIPVSEMSHVVILILWEHSFPSTELPRKVPSLPNENYLILKYFIYPVWCRYGFRDGLQPPYFDISAKDKIKYEISNYTLK